LLGRFSARNHWMVFGLWVVVAAAVFLLARSAGDRTADNLTLPGTDSTRAANVLESKLPQNAYGTNPMALETKKGHLTDSEYAKAIEATVKNLRQTPHVIAAISPLSKEGAPLLSTSKQIAYIPVTLDVGTKSLSKEEAQAVYHAANPARAAGIQAAIG